MTNMTNLKELLEKMKDLQFEVQHKKHILFNEEIIEQYDLPRIGATLIHPLHGECLLKDYFFETKEENPFFKFPKISSPIREGLTEDLKKEGYRLIMKDEDGLQMIEIWCKAQSKDEMGGLPWNLTFPLRDIHKWRNP